jgi:hypothetical protein
MINEQALINEYREKQAEFEVIQKRVADYFIRKASKLIAQDKGLDVLDILATCPDENTNHIIVDAINHIKRQ